MTLKPIPYEYTDDAKMVLGSFFGMGVMTELDFLMREAKPAPRTQAALDELVAEGALTVEKGKKGGVTYKSALIAEELRPYLSWMRKNSKRKDLRWTITTPLDDTDYPIAPEGDE